ncbi:uncharacterized protein [Eurosta solidaginis]|uniref:uncharacterized protein n=1 Tax=Eurosta solidaginis TaxID=178769 RepID=UPI0035312496
MIEDKNISNLNRWMRLKAIQQHFLRRWSTEYLHELQRKAKWTQKKDNVVEGDLVLNERRDINNIEKALSIVIGRYNELAKTEKLKKKRCQIITNEKIDLWSKQNFPIIRRSSIERKITNILNDCSTFLKYPSGRNVIMRFNKLCDVTNLKGIWLSTEDKALYQLQISTNGEVWYTTAKALYVHPSKTAHFKQNDKEENVKSTLCINENELYSFSSTETSQQFYSPSAAEYQAPSRIKQVKCSTKAAVAMVTKASVSTNNAPKICNQLAKEEFDLATPLHSGIYKASIKAAQRLEENIVDK